MQAVSSETVEDDGGLLLVIKAKREIRLKGITFERFLEEEVYILLIVHPNTSLDVPATL